ncbi:MAG TPA: M12 family metallopeptidase [Kofleriaceae bacterium]
MAPLDLVMENRVVLTPGHQVTVQVEIRREEPDPEHPVMLALTGGGTSGVTVTLDTTLTKGNLATLAIAVSDTAAPQEIHYALDGKLAFYEDHEALVVSVQAPTTGGADVAGAEEYAPGVTGVVKALTINGEVITYEVINGLAIVGGDVVLGDAATLEARLQARSATCNPSLHTDFACSAWTDGVIGYSFANNWGDDDENRRMRTIIEDAMEEWTRQIGIRFVPRTSGEFLQFRDGDGCSSGLGRVVFTGFDSQSITLNNSGCDTKGIAMHEIGHAIGLYHEQQRNDRNNWVVVDFGAVKEDKIGNFFQFGDFIVDRGAYNYGSIMHYRWDAFAKDETACNTGRVLSPPNFAHCSVYPTDPPEAIIGQRDNLSEGDLYGAYRLYPPVFRILGATAGQSGDRFSLRLDYDRGRPQVDRVVWTSDRVATPLGTGNAITIRASQVPAGLNNITASFVVDGITITSRSMVLNFSNAGPTISVVASNGNTQQHMNQVFSLIATATDAEDGACVDCRFTWNPVPTTGSTDTRIGSFRFTDAGPQTISVTVEDLGGATATATLTVDIVNTAPTVTIVRPTDGIVVASGTYLFLSGRGSDINSNTGTLPCTSLRWTSSNASDVFSSATGCNPTLRLAGGAGPRTLTLLGTDGHLWSAPDTVDFTVSACTATGCPPTAYFELSEPDLPDVYFIEREMAIIIRLGDSEHNEPITYRVYGRRVGQTTTFPIATGSEMLLDETTLSSAVDLWTPSASVDGGWPFCSTASQYRDYQIILEATDSTGMTTTFSRTVTLGCNLI